MYLCECKQEAGIGAGYAWAVRQQRYEKLIREHEMCRFKKMRRQNPKRKPAGPVGAKKVVHREALPSFEKSSQGMRQP